MVENFISVGMEQVELSGVQRSRLDEYIGDSSLTVGRMIELIYLQDTKADIRIRHFEVENEYKVSGIINGRPMSRVHIHLHMALFDILKAVL